MEFVAFVLCMSIIVQINAAPTPESGLNIPHHENEFDLPAVALAGFEMNIDITIVEKYHDQLSKMKVILLPNEELGAEDSMLVSEYCAGDNSVTQHTHVCIVPCQLQERSGEYNPTAIQRIRITATLNREQDALKMMAYLNGSYSSEIKWPLEMFEELRHFFVEGVAQNIQMLQFDFTKKR